MHRIGLRLNIGLITHHEGLGGAASIRPAVSG